MAACAYKPGNLRSRFRSFSIASFLRALSFKHDQSDPSSYKRVQKWVGPVGKRAGLPDQPP